MWWNRMSGRGSDKIYARFKEMSEGMDHVTVKIGEEIAHPGVKMSGCHGFCEMGLSKN